MTAGSGRKAWWRCAENPRHVWQAGIYSVVRSGRGCPFCAGKRATTATSLRACLPSLAAEWHSIRNGELTPDMVTTTSGRRVWWTCRACNHEWPTQVDHRAQRGHGCPACSGKVATRKTSLRALFPRLAAEWHPTKNGVLTPSDTVPGSSKRVYWRCSRDPSHEWQTTIGKRAHRGDGCPFCSGQRVTPTTSLAALHPHLAHEWHPRRNGDLTAHDVRPGSDRKVWWKCTKDPSHAWEAVIHSRARQQLGCPMCSRQRVTPKTSLRATHPEVARQWHPTRNGELTPTDVMSGSGRRVWWRCAKNRAHEWAAVVMSRARGTGCPICCGILATPTTSLRARYPAIAEEWHPTKNGENTPDEVTFRSTRQVWWRCATDPSHEWPALVYNRTLRGTRCPACIGRMVTATNSLKARYPRIAREWHPTKNGDLRPSDVVWGTHRRVWWQCRKDPRHAWEIAVVTRTRRGSDCPHCAGRSPSPFTSLRALHPELAAQWHPTRNRPLTPDDVVPGSNKRVWWRCPVGRTHVWETGVDQRARRGYGCPYCSGRYR